MGTPIVIDNGSSKCRIGFSGDDVPKFFFPTIIGYPKYEMMPGMNSKICIGP
jgi:actin-related protein